LRRRFADPFYVGVACAAVRCNGQTFHGGRTLASY
jgi:hypothetical protein